MSESNTPPRPASPPGPVTVDLAQRVYWEVDVTAWLEAGRSYTASELEALARDKWEYHDYGSGAECECTGWGWGE